jgi:hypothetical protein
MLEIIVTLIAAAIVFGFGIWSAQVVRDKSRARTVQASTGTPQLAENKAISSSEEPSRNRENPAGMGMAASGSKN